MTVSRQGDSISIKANNQQTQVKLDQEKDED